MKTTPRILLFCLALIAFDTINAQKSKIDSMSITMDCAKYDHNISVADISVADLKDCKKLVVTGTSHEKFKIVTAKVSILSNGNLKEFIVKEGIFNEQLTLKVSQLSPGSKIFIEQVKIQNINDPKIIKNLKTVSFVVK